MTTSPDILLRVTTGMKPLFRVEWIDHSFADRVTDIRATDERAARKHFSQSRSCRQIVTVYRRCG
jgi:hypothetical protein